MNLDALESFRVFAETLNFTHAAGLRHLSQPALHKQVRSLSLELGVDLYGKRGRTLYLTSAGIEVARFARDAHDRLLRLRGQVKGDRDDLPIGLSAGQGTYLYLLGPAIRAFQRRHPGILRLRVEDSAETVSAVRSGTAQFGITVLLEKPADLSLTPIQTLAPQLIVAAGHPLANRRSVNTKDMCKLPLIVPPDPSPLRQMLRAHFVRDQREFNPVMEVRGWELAMHFVSLGMGATVVNGCCRPPGGTRAIPLNGFPKTAYYLIEHPAGYSRALTTELKACLIKKAQSVHLFGS